MEKVLTLDRGGGGNKGSSTYCGGDNPAITCMAHTWALYRECYHSDQIIIKHSYPDGKDNLGVSYPSLLGEPMLVLHVGTASHNLEHEARKRSINNLRNAILFAGPYGSEQIPENVTDGEYFRESRWECKHFEGAKYRPIHLDSIANLRAIDTENLKCFRQIQYRPEAIAKEISYVSHPADVRRLYEEYTDTAGRNRGQKRGK